MGFSGWLWRRRSGNAPPPLSIGAESLECRRLLAYVLVGEELRANTFTDNGQINPRIAADADGDFVVTWASAVQDGSGFGVYAQRYSAAGLRRGGELRVNVTTFRWQENPAVAMDADGDFVIVWENHENDFERDVYARLYTAGGFARTGEIVVNQIRNGDQGRPSVAMSDDGRFVVAWHANDLDGAGRGVFTRRFSADGVAITEEIPVNTTTAGEQVSPVAAMDADGDFAVAWFSQAPGGITRSALVRCFSADGTPRSDEIPFASAENLDLPLGLAMSAGGPFVATWGTYTNDQGVFSGDVFAQRYTAAGTPAGGPITVNQTLPGAQSEPSAGMDADGNFLIAWSHHGNQGERELYARHFTAAGVPDGGEFPVNTSTAEVQDLPVVAMDDAGGAVIAWHSNHPGSNALDVYVQRFRRADPPTVIGVFLGASVWSAEFRTHLQARGIGESAFGFSVPAATQLATIPWTGIDRISVRFSDSVVAALDDLSVRGVNVSQYPVTAFNYDAPTRTATWTLGRSLRDDKVIIDVDGDAGGVSAGVLLDGDWTGNAVLRDAFPSGDGAPGGDFVFRINVLPGDVNGDRAVNAIDLLELRRRLISSGPSHPAYSPVHDLNGDAAINAVDLALLRRSLPSRLPNSEPAVVFAAAVLVPRSPPVRRSLLVGA